MKIASAPTSSLYRLIAMIQADRPIPFLRKCTFSWKLKPKAF